MKLIYKKLDEIHPYENNPRKNDDAVDAVAASIKEFGFKVPIIVDNDGEIIAGHTRYKAAKKLKLKEVPTITADDLTDDQVRAFRLADNKTGELASWDFDALADEMDLLFDIDMTAFGFEVKDDWFESRKRWDNTREEGNEEYNEFLKKFEHKKTTDDCYTPDNVYDAIAGWVAEEYSLDRSTFIRPFYPGGDYENERYPEGCVVVDNPPFSILAEITRFYMEREIPFFLFSPTLTAFSTFMPGLCYILADAQITYENSAVVNTAFRTNLEKGIAVRTAPELARLIDEANRENTKAGSSLLRYAYPTNVITAAMVSNWAGFGVDFRVPEGEAVRISALDAQKEKKLGIYGGGLLLSTAQAAQAAQAAGVDIEDINENGAVVWKLSDRELAIIAEMDKNAESRME